jgi:uncharacterized protein (TIGR04255 family)
LELGNPPVVEVGVEFLFNPDPEKKPWDLGIAEAFLDQFQQFMPHIEYLQAEEIRIDKRNPQGLPEKISGKISLDQVRAHDDEGRHWLQVGNDQMGYRLLRRESNYPGFQAVLEKAFDMLGLYIQHFRPSSVSRMILTYFDIINIATQAGEGIELNDYFMLGVKLPENVFGPLGSFAMQVDFPETLPSDRLRLLFASGPNEDGKLRFNMRWHTLCSNVDSLDIEDLRHRLATANEHVEKCFFACFTERGLELFSPLGSN